MGPNKCDHNTTCLAKGKMTSGLVRHMNIHTTMLLQCLSRVHFMSIPKVGLNIMYMIECVGQFIGYFLPTTQFLHFCSWAFLQWLVVNRDVMMGDSVLSFHKFYPRHCYD